MADIEVDDDDADGKKGSGKLLDSRKLIQAVVTALATAAGVGLGTWLLNEASQGGLIHAMGGLTKADLAEALKEKQQDSPGGVHVNDVLPPGAIVAFDVPYCPPGWALADQTVGSAIVGAGAVMTGEPGSPASNEGRTDGSTLRFDPTKGTSSKPPFFITHDPNGVPVSRFVFGVRSTFTPNYLPLWFCKKFIVASAKLNDHP
jgi:hypothetical protein